MVLARLTLVAALTLVVTLGLFAQAPAISTITGGPLRINVGSDGSFQVFNTAVPGFGQIFPTQATLADMGVFARIDGQLFAPDFRSHTGGTATSALTSFTPWTRIAITPQTGNGSPESPYTVVVSLRAGNTDVRMNLTVTYVNGTNFFRIRKHVFSITGTPHQVDLYLGADIFLASSDSGLYVSEPRLAAVGGRTCEEADPYNILLIPITPANRFTASNFSDVWRQINADAIDNDTTDEGCIDNGAAIQWQNVMRGSTSVEVTSAVSFGEVPDPANFFGFSLFADPTRIALSPGESRQVTIQSRHNPELDFNAPILFSATNVPQGMTITFDQNVVAAPGTGTVKATVTVDGTVFPRVYEIGIVGSGGNESHAAAFLVDVLCTLPQILGVNQLGVVTTPRGQPATLTIKAEGSGLYTYQWFEGYAGMTGNPVPDSNRPTLVTGPITELRNYWVRVWSPCGSVDSNTAFVFPTN